MYEPTLGTIADEAQQEKKAAATSGSASGGFEVNDEAAAIAAEAAAKASPLRPGLAGQAATATPASVAAAMASKMADRKFSAAAMSSIADTDIIDEDDLDAFTPYFQRVSISGDDNTGVSKLGYSLKLLGFHG